MSTRRRPYQLVTPDGRRRSFATCERAVVAAGEDSTAGGGVYLVQRRTGRTWFPVVVARAHDGVVEQRQNWHQLHAREAV